MSTPAQKANLARIRDNQRRSRARRREYLQELEQRLRVCELQGIEASAEVQMAARKVAEENRQLRELLNRYGASDETIASFLQSGAANPLDLDRRERFPSGDTSAAESLQQLLLPRRPAGLDQNVSFSLPTQTSREDSIASASTTSSSVWEATPGTMPSYSQHQQLGVASAVLGSSGHPQYYPPAFPANAVALTHNSLSGPSPTSMLSDPRQTIVTTQSMPVTLHGRTTMNNHYSMPGYHDIAARGYEPLRGELQGPPDDGC